MSSTPPPTTTTSASFLRPWQIFLNPSSLSLPISLSEASYRLTQNIIYFVPNYAVLTLIIFLLTLLTRPLTLIFFLCISAAWIYLLFTRTDEPLTILNYDIDQKIIVGFLSVMTLVAIFWTQVWLKLFIALLAGVVIVFLHAVLMAPEDSLENSPYGSLLDVVDSSNGYASV